MRQANTRFRQFRRKGAHRPVRLFGQPCQQPVPGCARQYRKAMPTDLARAPCDAFGRSAAPRSAKHHTVSPLTERSPRPPVPLQHANGDLWKVALRSSPPSSGKKTESQNVMPGNPLPDPTNLGRALVIVVIVAAQKPHDLALHRDEGRVQHDVSHTGTREIHRQNLADLARAA